MATQSNIQFFTNWAKERLDEMNAAVTSFEGKLAGVPVEILSKSDSDNLSVPTARLSCGSDRQQSPKSGASST